MKYYFVESLTSFFCALIRFDEDKKISPISIWSTMKWTLLTFVLSFFVVGSIADIEGKTKLFLGFSDIDPFAFFQSVRNDLSCTACQILIHAIDNVIIDPTNENAVADTLKPICGLLFQGDPPTLVNCEVFITTYVDDIIELLVNQYLKPEEVCIVLSLCP